MTCPRVQVKQCSAGKVPTMGPDGACSVGRRKRAGSPSVCFVAHNAYGALARTCTGHIGGIERQQSLMARWLASRGWRVSMVTWHEAGPPEEVIDGVRVIKMCRRDAGWPTLRFVHPRWTSLHRALRKADADLYYYNCGDLGLGQIALWCRRYRRTVVYSVASDPACDPRLSCLEPFRERFLYRYGLRHSHRVIVQTRGQQEKLWEGFGIPSTVLPMPCEVPDACQREAPRPSPADPGCVLWVGRISEEKRLEWLLEIAEQCPDLMFAVVGGANTQSAYVSALLRRADGLANVRMHGRVPHSEMGGFYRSAAVLCCTSVFEGFPNTFLEAWSHGVPVVSTFDPDDLIVERGLGEAARDVPALIAGIRQLLASPASWNRVSRNALKYFGEHHAVEAVMPQFERLFRDC